ncbi:long-subunit fatty acid transport protein [Lewinella aquimaris]|uniref:Long-subunit fatty acid transport protein n=1 Tax=Neolewinella aquimaris TaxID=1835722 RepID=A0A840EAQ7_9BACT|nr:PorV/PorQ family protein [Neolewinella aquimaris]MBB4081013.1 long-subunit fatty acid transport protein [Neolewinella aquimaris]
MKHIYFFALCSLWSLSVLAGNPDRQGEAGAAQLLMNPWAPSAGLHSLGTSYVTGVEAMRLNPAGVSRFAGTQVMLGYANYLQGTDISMQAIGVTSQVGNGGALGFSVMSLDFGDIAVTTTDQPEGTGALLNLSFINVGLTYSHQFENKVSVGITLRGVSEATSDVSSFGFAIDAGVQYVTGEKEEFKFGLSLRNVGSRMAYGGQALATEAPNPDPSADYKLTLEQRSAGFEMPSVLNIGASYDFLSSIEDQRVTLVGNFTANSFSRDQLGAGLEYAFREQFIARVGYRTDLDASTASEGTAADESPLYDGISAGASLRVPFRKGDPTRRFSVDYAYRSTRVYNGTHNVGLSLSF